LRNVKVFIQNAERELVQAIVLLPATLVAVAGVAVAC